MEEYNDKLSGSSKKKRPFKPTLKQLSLAVVVLGVLLLAVMGVLVYKKGESNGRKAAQKSPFNLSASLIDKLRSGSKASPIRTISGTVVSIKSDKVVIEQHNKDRQTIHITDDTRITLKGEDKKTKDISSGAKVTVFMRTASSTEKQTATRIVIRQEQ